MPASIKRYGGDDSRMVGEEELRELKM